jgi:hypothetical protein
MEIGEITIKDLVWKTDYNFRLITNKIKKRGKEKNNITLCMILNEVDEYVKKTGKLETKVDNGNWEKVGTFTEEYTNNPVEDYGKNYLELNMNKKKVLIDEHFVSDGTYQVSVAVKTKHRGWNVFVYPTKEVSVIKNQS